MSQLRRQSILSTVVIYSGFLIGVINTYLFTKKGIFTPDQYGLTTIFLSIAILIHSFASLGTGSYLLKFYPYYKDRIPLQKSDMLGIALAVNIIGVLIVATLALVFKQLVIQKFGQNSPLLVSYYNYIFPLGLGLSLYSLFEAFAWNVGHPVAGNFYKEVLWRIIISILIALYTFGIISSFDGFMFYFSLSYVMLCIALIFYLGYHKKFYLNFRISYVTKKFYKKILMFCGFLYSGALIYNFAYAFDIFVIASVLSSGQSKAGIFAFAQILTAVLQAPQRAINSVATPAIASAWKNKNLASIQKIYERTALNQLIFSLGVFFLIALNYQNALDTLKLHAEYSLGLQVFIYMGLTRVVDMGTGVNGQIIGTSKYINFEVISGVVLIGCMLPLSYILAKRFDIIGPALANLIATIVFNLIRIVFLWKKFGFFPFTSKTAYTLLIGSACMAITYFACKNMDGFAGLVIRTGLFGLLYIGAAIRLELSPDIAPILNTAKTKIRRLWKKG